MMGHTHLLIGGAAYLAAEAALVYTGHPVPTAGEAFGGWMIASYAALLPDLDSKNSTASKAFGWPSEGLSWVVRTVSRGHRKLTHSILGAAGFAALLYLALTVLHWAPWVIFAAATGWASHVLSDMVTKEGCPLLWPLSRYKFGLHLVTTGLDRKHGKHTSEWYVVTPVVVLATVIAPVLLLAGL